MTSSIITMHKDRIVTSAFFRGMDVLHVTSIFRNIQSEGPFAGHPAMFVRLAGCNFSDKQDHCSWCDTFFAVDAAKQYTAQELLDEMAAKGWQASDVLVFTGGEPTLQHYLLKVIGKIKTYLPAATVQLETNGTQAGFFSKYEDEFSADFDLVVVCSPKAGPKGYMRLSPTVLGHINALKFVVSAEEGVHHEVPEWALKLAEGSDDRCEVYVSPMAQYLRAYDGEVSSIWDDTLIDKEKTAANYSYAAAYALKHNLLLSLQGHLFCALP